MSGMKININARLMSTDILNSMTAQEIQQTAAKDEYLQQLPAYIIRGWQESRN